MSNRAAFVVLVLWVVAAPILLGSVPDASVPGDGALARFLSGSGAYCLFRTFAYVAVGLVLPAILVSPGVGIGGGRSGRKLLIFAGLLLGLAVLQLVPLPRGIHSLIAPAHAADLDALLPEGGAHPISTDPGWTERAAVRLAVLLFGGLVILRTVNTPRRSYILLGALAGVAALVAGYGILETGALGDRVLGFAKMAGDGGVTGTFIYRGNFAAFTATGLGVAAACLVAAFRGQRPGFAALAAMALVLLAGGLVLSRSRAGLLAGGVAVAVAFALPLRSRMVRLGTVAAVVGALVVLGLSVGSVRERFTYLANPANRGFMDVRIPAWEASLDLASGRPVFGAGLGAFRRAIHLTQSTWNPEELYFAHSDVVNVTAEGGIVGLVLLGGLAILGFLGAARLARDRESPVSGIGAACAGGLAGLLTMAALDFPLQIPATSLAFIVLIYLPAASVAPCRAIALPRRTVRLAGLVAVSAVALLLIAVAGDYRSSRDARAAYSLEGRERLRRNEMLRSFPAVLTPGEAHAVRAERDEFEGRKKEALENLVIARRLQPFEGATRYLLARTRFRTEGPGSEAAQAELEASYRLARGRGPMLFRIGSLALGLGLPFATEAMREAGALEPGLFSDAMNGLRARRPDLVKEIVPERGFAWMRYAAWKKKEGDTDEAVTAYWHAYDLGEREEVERRLADIYRDLDREQEGRKMFAEKGARWP